MGTRSSEWRGASKGLGLARRVLAKCFFGKGIKLPGFSVSFDLAIPNLPVELQEPVTKLRELLRRKVLDLTFNSLDLAHLTYLCISMPAAYHVRLTVGSAASAAHQTLDTECGRDPPLQPEVIRRISEG